MHIYVKNAWAFCNWKTKIPYTTSSRIRGAFFCTSVHDSMTFKKAFPLHHFFNELGFLLCLLYRIIVVAGGFV